MFSTIKSTNEFTVFLTVWTIKVLAHGRINCIMLKATAVNWGVFMFVCVGGGGALLVLFFSLVLLATRNILGAAFNIAETKLVLHLCTFRLGPSWHKKKRAKGE